MIILALSLSSPDVPPALRPLPGLTSQSCLPSTQTTSEVTAWLQPPSPGWKTNLGSTSPNSSPLAWLPYITQNRPPSRPRPPRWPRLHVTSRLPSLSFFTRARHLDKYTPQTEALGTDDTSPSPSPASSSGRRRWGRRGYGCSRRRAEAEQTVLYLQWLRALGISNLIILYVNVWFKQSCNFLCQ